MKRRKIVFLCYSRYVLYTAYFLKLILHEDDYCTLIISDVIKNENGIINHVRGTEFWNRVIKWKEEGVESAKVKENVQDFIENEQIDIFYTANVMRCASHFFVHFLKDNTEINMFDEGIISLDLIKGYEFFKRRGLPTGWIEFDFDKIEKFYVFFPEITKSIGKAQILPINWEKLISTDMLQFVNEINTLFDYKYTKINKKIMFIDSDMAGQGSITQEYENHCIQNVMSYIDTAKCVIKLKPSTSEKMVSLKYGKYDVDFMDGGNVPFEVVYLNAIINNDVPDVIIALPTTTIWNINLINQKLGIKNVEIITLSQIMYDYFYYPENGDDMMNKIHQYQRCFSDNYEVRVPLSWKEFYEYLYQQKRDLCAVNCNDMIPDEYNWLVREYNRIVLLYEKNKFDSRNIVLRKWVALNNKGVSIEEFFTKQGIKEIVLYGYGVFGGLFVNAVNKSVLKIQYVIKTIVTENDKIINDIPVLAVDECAEIIGTDTPILITAVGKESEVLDIIQKYNLNNKVYKFSDIMKYFDNI